MTEENASPSAGVESTAPSSADVKADPQAPASEGTTTEADVPVTENAVEETQEEKEAREASEAGKKLNERKSRFQERAQELNSRWQQERNRADRLQQRVQELEGKIARPDPSQYDDPQKYQADDAAAVAAQYRHEDVKAEAEAATARAHELREETWRERTADFAIEATDFHEVVTNPSLSITPFMAQSIQLMDDGPQVAYHLGKNPQDARRISRMEPHEALFELGRISARISSPPMKRVTQAPQPVKTVSGSAGGPTKNPEQMSMAEYAAWRKAGGGK